MVLPHEVTKFEAQLHIATEALARIEHKLHVITHGIIGRVETEVHEARRVLADAAHPDATLEEAARVLRHAVHEQRDMHEKLRAAHSFIAGLPRTLNGIQKNLTLDFETVETNAPALIGETAVRVKAEFQQLSVSDDKTLDADDTDIDRLMARIKALSTKMLHHDFRVARPGDQLHDQLLQGHLRTFDELQEKMERLAHRLHEHAETAIAHVGALRLDLERELEAVREWEPRLRRAA